MDTHVFLGPTLDLATAKQYLPHANYHPPIQCGDIVRLLRVQPKRMLIIDGLYEQVPAVWHKEIMLALDLGILVYGAASMGALRAAELHQYGMIGVGKVFQAFLNGVLTDDDEVAVLHQGSDNHFMPLNDAMVNIRETLDKACQENIITFSEKKLLIEWCKSQFYPNRLLQQGIKHLSCELKDKGEKLAVWLQHHFIDIKRLDAIQALEQVEVAMIATKKYFTMPYTKFIGSMVDDEINTAFKDSFQLLSATENKLTYLSTQKPDDYHLILELAGLIKNAYMVLNKDELLENPNDYLQYIKTHDLYFSNKLYQFLSQHETLAPLSFWLLHYTCLANISAVRMQNYLPALKFYFSYASDERNEFLCWILLLIFLLHQQLNDERLTLKKNIVEEHLKDIQFWRRFEQAQINGGKLNKKIVLDFVMMYMKVIYIHHGVKDFKLGLADAPQYFHWAYDAMALYEC